MKTYRQFISTCVLVACVGVARTAFAAEQEEARSEALASIRAAAAGRDLAAVREKLTAAGKLKGEAKYDAELLRLEELGDYLEKFWQAVDRGAKTLDGTQELLIGEERVAFVEYENGTLVLRVKGQNRSYTAKTLPAKIALTLSHQVLKPDAAANKVFFGAFLVLDGKGDVELARAQWKEAAAAGVDVQRLLPEIGAERPLPPLEIPPVTLAMSNLLAETNWSLRVQGEKGWTRHPVGKWARRNSEGRLAVRVPAEESEALQLVAKKPISGDFVVRLILTDVKKGQTLGLFAADAQDTGYFTELPAGTFLVEFGRRGGEFKCTVGGKSREVQAIGKSAPKMAGVIGLSLPAGTECTIAAIEFAGR